MPTAITCPSCRRVLNLPAEALNRMVQCPACKHQFHPAEALPAEAVRPAPPRFDYAGATAEPPASPVPAPPEPNVERRAPPPPPPSYDIRRGDRRGKRETEDLCPQCKAFVPRDANKCPECGAEFLAEDDESYRPWEQEGVERRDSEPHRGTMLLWMGIGSIVLACLFFLCFIGVLTSLAGLVMGSAAAWMGRIDLKKMDQHLMKADGRSITSGAMICGFVGLALNLLALPAAIALTAMVL
jgi:hypothetical protein